MQKKVNCYFNYYPHSQQNSQPKKFSIYSTTAVTSFKNYFKDMDHDRQSMICCLDPFTEDRGYSNIIDVIPEDIPDNIYFYSIPHSEELKYFRDISIKVSDTNKEYNFRLQTSDTSKTLNEKFKELHQNKEKTPYVYKMENGSWLPGGISLESIPQLKIKLIAIPKLASISIFEDGKYLDIIKMALSFFKKTAAELFKQNIASYLKKSQDEIEDYSVYYEYNNKIIPEHETLSPLQAGSSIKLHLNRKTEHTNKNNENEVEVLIQNEDGTFKNEKMNFSEIQYKSPKQIVSLTKNYNHLEQEQLNNKQIEVRIDNVSVDPENSFKKGKKLQITFLSTKTKNPQTYSITSPDNSISSEPFNDFKKKLKDLVNRPDSNQNDLAIKSHLASYIAKSIFK